MAEKTDQLYNALGMDTFNFWPVAGNEHEQICQFAEEVVPAVREQIQEILSKRQTERGVQKTSYAKQYCCL